MAGLDTPSGGSGPPLFALERAKQIAARSRRVGIGASLFV